MRTSRKVRAVFLAVKNKNKTLKASFKQHCNANDVTQMQKLNYGQLIRHNVHPKAAFAI
jgi:hypothetical protein